MSLSNLPICISRCHWQEQEGGCSIGYKAKQFFPPICLHNHLTVYLPCLANVMAPNINTLGMSISQFLDSQ